MKWTDKKPTETDKHYWYQPNGYAKQKIILLLNIEGELWCFSCTSRFPLETAEGKWSDKAIEPPTE